MTIKGSWLADICGVSRQRIYALVKKGELQKNPDGTYDTKNKLNKSFLVSQGKTEKDVENFIAEKNAKKSKSKKNTKTEKTKEKEHLPEVSDDVLMDITGLPSEYLTYTIKELVLVRGSVAGLKEWVYILKTLISAEKDEQQTKYRRNELIEKDFVVSNLKKYLDLFIENLQNSSDGFVEQIIAMVKADEEVARKEIPKLLSGEYTKISKQAKSSITRSLNALKRKYEDGEE